MQENLESSAQERPAAAVCRELVLLMTLGLAVFAAGASGSAIAPGTGELCATVEGHAGQVVARRGLRSLARRAFAGDASAVEGLPRLEPSLHAMDAAFLRHWPAGKAAIPKAAAEAHVRANGRFD